MADELTHLEANEVENSPLGNDFDDNEQSFKDQ